MTMTNDSIPNIQRIKNLKNFGSIDQSFKKWLTTCPKDYIWEINQVTKDQTTFTFWRLNELQTNV